MKYENPVTKSKQRKSQQNFVEPDDDGDTISQSPQDAIAGMTEKQLKELNSRLTPKEEKIVQKTLRTFFFMQAIGHVCRIRKVDSQSQNDDEQDSEAEKHTIIIEGLLESCDANSTHVIIAEACMLKVYGSDPFCTRARTTLVRRAPRASINMNEVKEIRFQGIDIKKDGMKEIAPKTKASATSESNFLQDSINSAKISTSPQKTTKTSNNAPSPAATSKAKKQAPLTTRNQKVNNFFPDNKSSLDEIYNQDINKKIDSKLTPKKNKINTPKSQKKARELIKWDEDNEQSKMEKLEDTKDVSKFDQFKDKATTYDFNNYTSTLDKTKITGEQRQIASKIEKELAKDEQSKKMAKLENEADDDAHAEELKFSAVTREEQAKPLVQFKKQLMDHLGANDLNQKPQDQRSRKNSLRNGETSKVIQTHNIDVPIMEKDQCDSYKAFTEQQSQNIPPRKESMEYFKEESQKIQSNMEQKGLSNPDFGKKFDCINKKADKNKFEQCYSLAKRDRIQDQEIEEAKAKARELIEDNAIIVDDEEEYPVNQSEYMRFLSKELVTTRWMGFNKV